MISKIKQYIIYFLLGLSAFFAALAGYRGAQRDKAEKEKAESDLDRVTQVNEHNKKVSDVKNAIDEKRTESDSLSDSDVDARMHKYDRARNHQD